MGSVYSEWRYIRDRCYTVERTLDRLVERVMKSAIVDRTFLGRFLAQDKKGNLAEKREKVPAHKAKMRSYFHRKEPICDAIKLAA